MKSIEITLVLYIVFILLWILITFKVGDWRNWRKYYPTILFFWIGNLMGFAVLHDDLLWEFKSSILSHVATDFLQMLFIFTCTTILFLQWFPKKIISQIVYTLIWVSIYTLIEFFFYSYGAIVYHHGWSIWWSGIHNIYQFTLLRIHYKKPILAWILSFAILGIMMCIFKITI